jgi:hypothetical protein
LVFDINGEPTVGGKPSAPALASTILRSMLAGAGRMMRAQALDARLADLCLNLNVALVGMLEFQRVEEIAEIGYEQSLEPIRAWIEQGGLRS